MSKPVYHYRPKNGDRAICGYRGSHTTIWPLYFIGLAKEGCWVETGNSSMTLTVAEYDGELELCEDCLKHPDVVLELLAIS